jgi:hypothetical protein
MLTILIVTLSELSDDQPMVGFQSPEMAAAKYAKGEVIGNLGGMPVTIPPHFAHYVEYDGDPGWGERMSSSRPLRDHQSKLRGFSFKVRYPDMGGADSPGGHRDQVSYPQENTPWIHGLLNTGQDYSGDGFMDRWVHRTVEIPNRILKYANYEKLPKREYELTIYAPTGLDPKTKKPYREDDDAKDVFISRDQTGKVETYIYCSNRRGDWTVQICTQVFSLEPRAKADVSVSYRRNLLPEWWKIQQAVRRLIFDFSVPSSASICRKSDIS